MGFASRFRRLCCLAVFLLFANAAAAQTTRQPPATNQESLLELLIQEVRQLRIAIENNSAIGFRAQIAVERLRAQQELISRLNGDLERLRQQLGELKAESGQLSGVLEEMGKKVEAGLLRDEDFRLMKAQIESARLREQVLRERETSLMNQLHLENGRLQELNQRLDMLEQILDAPQKSATSPKNRKN